MDWSLKVIKAFRLFLSYNIVKTKFNAVMLVAGSMRGNSLFCEISSTL